MLVRRVFRLVLALLVLVLLAAADRPREAEIQMRFGADMARRGSWKEAEFRFRKAAALAPGDPEILNNLAVACENNGRYADAALHYAAALDGAPDNERIRENYEHFRFFRSKHFPEAVEGEPAPDAHTSPAEGAGSS